MAAKGWEFINVGERVVHFVPVDDLIAHEPGGCICGPSRDLVEYTHGTHGLVVTHYSLDGREAHE